MATLNCDLLYNICQYLSKTNVKKFNALSKKYHQVAKYLLIYTFKDHDFVFVNSNLHYKINLICNRMPNSYFDRIIFLNLSNSNLISLPDIPDLNRVIILIKNQSLKYCAFCHTTSNIDQLLLTYYSNLL